MTDFLHELDGRELITFHIMAAVRLGYQNVSVPPSATRRPLNCHGPGY